MEIINKKLEKNWTDLKIPRNTNLHSSLIRMDEINMKLLIVVDESGKFESLLSIGDIQRAIIKGVDLKAPISMILRTKFNVCSNLDSKEYIKGKMLDFRCEFMPIVSNAGDLLDVVFWDEIFTSKDKVHKSMQLPIVIMAGGKGTRLRPITNVIPKPLVPIGDKTIMEVIINKFNILGCKEFYCSVNYKSNMIKQYFNDLDKNYKIDYFEEAFPMGTAGSLSLLKGKLDSTFVVNNCDIIIDQDYNDIYEFHKEHKYKITIVAAIKNYHIPYGTLEIGENGKLESIQEKPDLTYFVNTGMYFIEPELLDLIPDNKMYHITDLFEDAKIKGYEIGVFPVSEGAWLDIGNWKEYGETQLKFKNRLS